MAPTWPHIAQMLISLNEPADAPFIRCASTVCPGPHDVMAAPSIRSREPAVATPGPRVLIIESDRANQLRLAGALKPQGFGAHFVDCALQALALLSSERFEGLLVELSDRDREGWDLLSSVSELDERPTIVALATADQMCHATKALEQGVADVVEKPVSLAELGKRVHAAVVDAESDQRIVTKGAIAVSPAMQRVFALAERVARTPSSSALITGESGAGKEIVATHIHESSSRRDKPFVRVNLAAFPESMIEAELFGAARGAFTDSKKERPGLLASADGGTLMLDEITEFRIDLQPKLLRVLEERRYFQLGQDRERKIDLRIIGATNRNPLEAITDGHLRNDLYFRLATVTIDVPPLRKRKEDVLPLAEHFLAWFGTEFGRRTPHLTIEAQRAIAAHSWPGNVRELRNVVERAVIMTEGDLVDVDALMLPAPSTTVQSSSKPLLIPPPTEAAAVTELSVPTPDLSEPAAATVEVNHGAAIRASGPPVRISRPSMIAFRASRLPLKLELAKQQTLEAVERRQIERALEMASGNKTTAASMLGISRTTLWEKMKQYQLS